MAIFPPEQRIWWKQPLHWQELVWIAVCLVWALTMFFTMIVWHSIGEQNLSNEAYQISPDKFAERTEAMVEKYQVREEGDSGRPVVHPPPESEVYPAGFATRVEVDGLTDVLCHPGSVVMGINFGVSSRP